MPLTDLVALNRAFTEAARSTPLDAPIRSEDWPTAESMIDHLGTIQAWVTEVVRTGERADRDACRRKPTDDPAEWFAGVSERLVEMLEETEPARACWVLWAARPEVAFWRRRMTNEAAKHLWDLRTAGYAAPAFPAECGVDARVGIVEEFVELLVPAARARGIDDLPRDLVLVANDTGHSWRFARDWTTSSPRAATAEDAPDADVLSADLVDLVLFIWQRADPDRSRGRFTAEGDGAAVRAFFEAPVHL